MKKIWNYFKSSWEGQDGKFSYKRASIFVFVWCMVALALNKIQNKWEFYTFLTFAILYALQTAIITVSQLFILLKQLSKDKQNILNAGVDIIHSDNPDPEEDLGPGHLQKTRH